MSISLLELEADRRNAMQVEVNGKLEQVATIHGNSGLSAKAAQLVKSKMTTRLQGVDAIEDGDWVKSTLFGGNFELDADIELRRFWTSADRKFQDTSLGGGFACNPLPGYTPYADVPKPGLARRDILSPLSNAANLGMGSYYSRAHDDTARLINFRVGKPEFNSIAGYLTTYFDGSSASLANTGRFNRVGYLIGRGIGAVAMAGLFGVGGAIVYLSAKYIAGGLYGIIASNPYKFYYVKPTMPLYWLGVTRFVNDVLTHKGVFPAYEQDRVGEPRQFNQQMFDDARALAPDIFGTSGFVDVYAVINRAERINQRVRKAIAKAIDESTTNEQLVQNWKKVLEEGGSRPASNGLLEILHKWKDSEIGGTGKDGKKNSTEMLAGGTMEERYQSSAAGDTAAEQEKGTPAFLKDPAGWISSKLSMTKEYLDAEFSDGAQFATFRVHETGPTSESFANSTRPSDLGQKLNALSAQGRAIHNTIAGGNILPGMSEFVEGAQAVLTGTLDTFGLGGLLQAAGSAYADIPEFWDNSSANMPEMSYTMHLAAPDAHPLSQLQFIWIPLAMIFNMAVPHAAGRASYGPPYFIEAYDQGHAICRAGIMSQLSISRGTSTLPFNKNRDMLACDVNFSIKPLSTAMYMPIDTGFNIDPFNTIHTHDSNFSDYLSVLGAAKLGEQVYKGQKLRIRARNWVRGDIQSLTSLDQWAGIVRNLPGVNMFDFLYPDSGRGL